MHRPTRLSPLLAAAAAAAALAAACADVTPVAPPDAASGSALLNRTGPRPAPAEPTRYLVGYAGPTTSIPAAVLAASGGGRVVGAIPAFNVLVVEGATNPKAFLDAGARYVEPEFVTTLDAIPADGVAGPLGGSGTGAPRAAAVPEGPAAPWYASNIMWDMKAMKADQGWALTNGGTGIVICVVDTGVDDLHQELAAGKVLMRANFVTAEPRVDDPNGHGTHVAGTAAARGTVVAGVAPRASIMSARVLSAAGSGSETAIVNGIRWCADNGAHVINMSIGGVRFRGLPSFVTSPITYGNAVAYANAAGVVVIVSAGNNNFAVPNPSGAMLHMPSEVPGVVNVGATGPLSKVGAGFVIGGTPTTLPLAVPNWDPFNPDHVWQGPDGKAFYSNFGTGVQVFAPGGRGGVPFSSPYRFHNKVTQGVQNDAIWSACSGQSTNTGAANVGGAPGPGATCSGATNRYWAINGTSMAAPHVAGLAALLYAELGAARSDAKRLRVMNCLRTTTDNIGPATTFGGGRVNAQKAIQAIRAATC